MNESLMHSSVLSILSGIAVLIFFSLICWMNRNEKLSITQCISAFGFGMLSIFPAVGFETFGGFILLILQLTTSRWVYHAVDAFIVTATSEELVKFFALWIVLSIWPVRHRYFSVLVLSALVSLGFALVENFCYIFTEISFLEGISTGFSRNFTAVPAHFLFGLIMGYYITLGEIVPFHRWRYRILGILLSIFAHGAYDYILFLGGSSESAAEIGILTFLFLLLFFFTWVVGVGLAFQLQDWCKTNQIYLKNLRKVRS